MKIIIPGGSGHLGRMLAAYFFAQGDEVIVLTRQPKPTPWGSLYWDGCTPGPWVTALEGADVVINLAGRSVNCRYNPSNRREILQSRVRATRVLGEAVAQCTRPPKLWLQMSTATIYPHTHDRDCDESTHLETPTPEDNFSEHVAHTWEAEAKRWSRQGTRLVLMRTAMVMSAGRGGPYRVLAGLARLGLGGPSGDGRQFVAWIHERDFVRAVSWLIYRDEIQGPVNLAAPNPLPNQEFMQHLRSGLNAPPGLSSPKLILELGAFFLRTESELMLKSRRVVSKRLSDEGFHFFHPTWPEASASLAKALRPQTKKDALVTGQS